MNVSDQKDDNKQATNNTIQSPSQKPEDNKPPKPAQNSLDTNNDQDSIPQEKVPNFTWGGLIFLLVLAGISYMMFKYINM